MFEYGFSIAFAMGTLILRSTFFPRSSAR